MRDRIKLVQGDITKVDAEAIVNAANNSLLGGGGVDGAIHRAAGPGLLEECWGLGGCNTGEAKITGGHNLKADFVIHTVGPVWRGGSHNESELLALCYRNSLRLAKENNLRSIAFPSISTGVFGYPIEKASKIALQEIKNFLENNPLPEQVILVSYSLPDYQVYSQAVANIFKLPG